MYFLTMTTVGWIDIFTRQNCKDVLVESLRFCQKNKGLRIYSYVIMSNHIHCIVQAEEPFLLSDIIRDFKKYSSSQLVKVLSEKTESRKDWIFIVLKYHAQNNINNSKHQLRQQNNHPIELFSPSVIAQKMEYIHNNPVRAGIVNEPNHYIYSSASNYFQGNGILDVTILEFPLM